MADRWQIIKKTGEGIFRATANREDTMKAIVAVAQADPGCKYIVVKDRVTNRRGLVWRRSQSEPIDWWILRDPFDPDKIQFRQRVRAGRRLKG